MARRRSSRSQRDREDAAALKSLLVLVPWWAAVPLFGAIYLFMYYVVPWVFGTEVVYNPQPNKVDEDMINSILGSGISGAAKLTAPLVTIACAFFWFYAKLEAWFDRRNGR